MAKCTETCPKCGSRRHTYNKDSWGCGSYVRGNFKQSDLCEAWEELAAANAEIERLRAENERLVNRITELNSELTQTELAVEQLQIIIDAI